MSKKQSFQISLKLIQTQFNKGLNNVKKQLRSFGSFVKSAFALGTVTAFGRKMIQVGADFENAMSRVKAVTNATRREFNMMQKEAQRLGATTKYTATEAANALETLTRNGMSATQATRALSGVLELAQANSIELANAADIITNSLNMFGMQVSETSRVNDVLSSTAANSATDINLLYEALVNAAPAAHVLGFSIEETSAALGALANQGVKGANAGTAIRTALTKMADPKIIKKMKEMGVAIDEQTMKEEGLLGTVKRLQSAQLSLSDLVAIFSQRGAVGIQQLISAYDDFEYMLDVTKNSAGTTTRMFQQGVGSVQKEVATLKSQYESLLITISQKTSGAVKGVIRLLQNLINNFKSVTGTVLNLASVLVPLLSKHVSNLIKVTRAGLKAIKTEAASVSAMLGNWIGLIMTAVTWIGTALYGAWNRTYGAVKEVNKETAKTTTEYSRLKTQAGNLIDKLGPDTDKKTLAGIIKTLTELFPDFKSEIHDAAVEAGKTGNWEKLKGVLSDIVALQGTILAQDTNKKLAEANSLALGSDMFMSRVNMGLPTYFIDKQLKDDLGYDRSTRKEFFNELAKIITGEDRNTAVSVVKDYLENTGVKLDDKSVEQLADYFRGSQHGIAAIEANRKASAAGDIITQHEQEVQEALTNAEKERLKVEEEAARIEDEKNKKKSKQKTIDDIEAEHAKELENITDDLEHEFITNEEALKRLTNAYKKAYEDFRNLTGAKGADNKYYDDYSKYNSTNTREGMAALPFFKDRGIATPGNLPAITAPKSFQGKATVPFEGVKHNTQSPLELQAEQYKQFIETFNKIDTATEGLGQMHSITQGIVSSFETLNDEEATFIDKLGASINLMQAIPAIMKTINTVFGITNNLQDVYNKKAGKGASLTLAEAIAAMFKGNGEIPIAGIAIAAAGVATLIAALAMAPKFAQGGIVGGNSFSGDKNFARVNSGEMILNGTQQAKLFDMINKGASNRTQDVQFVIRGKDLYGALKNYNDSTSKIRSNL